MFPSRVGGGGTAGEESMGHFRAHARSAVHLSVILRGDRTGWERPGVVLDINIAGVGVETDEPLIAGDRVSIAFHTPTLWDPLVLSAVVAWAHPSRPKIEVDALGRPKTSARAGLAFDYPTPDATLAVFEMLVAIGFE